LILVSTVTAACQDISCGIGLERHRLTLAAGPAESAAGCLARAFTTQLNQEHPDVASRVLRTDGALDSLLALQDGRADLAIATADMLALAVNREGPFEGHTVSARTLATLYAADVYLVAPADSALNGLSQLRDSTVGVGPPGSGMTLTVSRLLAAARLESRVRTESLPWDELLARFRDRRLPAFFWVDGAPSPALERLTSSGAHLRVLNTASVVPLLQQRYGEILYTAVDRELEAAGFDADRAGLAAVWMVLVSRHDLADRTAYMVTSALFRLTRALTRACAAASGLNAKTGARPQPAALHPGAALFYRQEGTDRAR
jgi:TRAP transporter TAXI family solute receptor